MFQHLFSSMHALLDELIQTYPDPLRCEEQSRELEALKSISDDVMEQWLAFEEKLGQFQTKLQENADTTENDTGSEIALLPPEIDGAAESLLTKGQGYYKLFMFQQAASLFEQAVGRAPDHNLARIFLAMTHMHLKSWNEAQRHFQFLVGVADQPKWRALAWNALGCIQAIRCNMERAEQYFIQAHEADPSFAEPLSNLDACRQTGGTELSLYFGSAQLGCL
ncbi:hypothetical protein IDH44_07970 [Paenibacillus sp. IB182496]|uniref:Tetratricopeptide repeat protein n=1 Tax=Paenibacillus sabuli TaxID=2772509 RepID=A0A927BT00_9BACL|nr:tetratricopeptide repeat protein [Paenibacillus sabuli]MBD2845125.1 hypothetical protein [Paenibacillus sabuli]